MKALRERETRLALAAILMVAIVLRLYGLDWDAGQHTHPDERWIAMVSPTITWPKNAAEVLDPRRSTLNPLWVPDGQGGGHLRNFAYGHLPLYLHALVGHALGAVGDWFARRGPEYQALAHEFRSYGEYGAINVVGRALSVLADVGTIYLVSLLGRRLYDRRTALLGSALTALAVTHIQLAHFAAFDAITTFFITLSVYGSVCVVQAKGRGIWPTIWAGAAAGMAVASKFSAAPLVAVLVLAQLLRAARQVDRDERYLVLAVIGRAWASILLGIVVAALAVFLTSPFAILDWRSYLKQIVEQGAMVRGTSDLPYTRQYRNTTPFLYQIAQQVRWGLGWPLGLTAFAGFAWTLAKNITLRHTRAEELVLLGWAVPYFLLTGTFMVKFMRYMLPLLPLFILMGARLLVEIGKWASQRARGLRCSSATLGSSSGLGVPRKVLRDAPTNGQIGKWANGQSGNTQVAISQIPRTVEKRNIADPLYCRRSPVPLGGWGTQYRRSPVLSAIPRSIGGLGDAIRTSVYCLLRSLPYVVLLGTCIWTLAFMRVYAQTHPWIQASRWVYENVPDGSVIAVEHWDDHLPLSLPEPHANFHSRGYRHVELPMYEPDGYDKLMLVRDRLREADYLILSTNRLYRTIPRLPKRYPISTEFYRLLFEGKLGYVKEVEFTAYPGLLGIEIRDDDADESFTVYDHPKPLVLRKERDLDDGAWIDLFAEALNTPPLLEEDEKQLPTFLDREPARSRREERPLLLDRPVGDLPVVSDFDWNRWAGGSTIGATALWWLALGFLGWLAWPLSFAIFRGLRDRGYLLSRSVGLLVVGYLIWLPSSLHVLKNGLPLTLVAIGLFAVLAGLLAWRNWNEMRAFVERRWRILVLGEVIFGVAYLAFVGIRILNPDLWQPWNGGEKLMDIAYLNACLRSAHLPPYDPYFSDGYLNYYYYGQFLMSILVRMTGIRATVAFNLAVPTFFALTASTTFSVGYTLAGKVLRRGDRPSEGVRFGIGHGLLAVLCVTVFGNLASATQIIEHLGWVSTTGFKSRLPGLEALVRAVSGAKAVLLGHAKIPAFSYWDPSRVVGQTINEFPYWTFLFADLHPHLMNIPFTLLVIALALNWLLYKRAPVRAGLSITGTAELPRGEWGLLRSSFVYVWQRLDWGQVLVWLVWPLALGVLWPTNSWDWPAYAGLSGLVLLIAWIKGRGKQGVVPALAVGMALAAGSLILYWPFLQYHTPVYVGFGWSLGRGHTELGEFLTVWGFFLFLAISLLLILLARQRTRWASLRLVRLAGRYLTRLHRLEQLYVALVQRRKRPRWSTVGLGVLIILMLIAAWKGYWVLVLMLPLLALAAALLAQENMSDERRFVLALVFTSFLLLVGVELFYLKDHLDGDQTGWWRMNTLFKFYLQVWIMLGAALGASLPEIWRAVERWWGGGRWAWTALLGLLLVAVSIFFFVGTPARVMDRFPGDRPPIGTLDGMAFMTVGTYTWPDDSNPIHLRGDYDAIRWLLDNVPGTPVLAEAPVGYYREFGVRVSSYTGLPTLVGMHANEQRWGEDVGKRHGQADRFFQSAHPEATMAIAGDLGIEYVYMGPLERTQYPAAEAKFEQLAARGSLSVVYENEQVTIYRVLE
jgi:YYY domain-containing protein